MPYSRISLLRGKSPEYLKTLSATLQDTMEETFDVPKGDYFQVIHQVEENELLFDRDYLGGPRSDDYVLFHITIGKQRTTEVKKKFYKQLVMNLHERLGMRPEDVMIVISSTQAEDWSFSKGTMFAL